jgi:hypothetical protein
MSEETLKDIVRILQTNEVKSYDKAIKLLESL